MFFSVVNNNFNNSIMIININRQLRIMIMIAMIFISGKSGAQNGHNKAEFKEKDIYVLAEVEKSPEFPGGMTEFYKFIGKNFKIPLEARKNNIEGKVYMRFVIEKDGSLSDVTTLKDLGYGIGNEAIRVLKLSPKWTAATLQGKAVRVMYTLPIMVNTDK